MDCPGWQWSHHPGKCSRNNWMWHLWFCGLVDKVMFSQRWDLMILKVFFNFKDSTILCCLWIIKSDCLPILEQITHFAQYLLISTLSCTTILLSDSMSGAEQQQTMQEAGALGPGSCFNLCSTGFIPKKTQLLLIHLLHFLPELIVTRGSCALGRNALLRFSVCFTEELQFRFRLEMGTFI